MLDLAQRSPNSFYAMHLVSGKIVCHESGHSAGISSKSGKRASAAAA